MGVILGKTVLILCLGIAAVSAESCCVLTRSFALITVMFKQALNMKALYKKIGKNPDIFVRTMGWSMGGRWVDDDSKNGPDYLIVDQIFYD